MKKSRFSEEQIIKALQEHEVGGKTVVAVSRELGFSQATFHKWKQKYGGMNDQPRFLVPRKSREFGSYHSPEGVAGIRIIPASGEFQGRRVARERCGRKELYSLRHISIRTLASRSVLK